MSLTWIAVDVHTGNVLADMPDLASTGLQHTMSTYNTTTATFPVVGTPAPPSNWLDATVPYKTMMVALNDDNTPVWGGIVGQRQRQGARAVQLTLTTPEGYTARRYIRDTLQYPQADRVSIASDLIGRYIVDGASSLPGLPLRVTSTTGGVLVDGDYKDTDDRTVYAILGDLGLEWTFGLEWQAGPSRITPYCVLSEHLGTAANPGLAPAVTLDWPGGNLVSAQIVEDYSDGKGANDILAVSTGQGEVRPQSAHQNAAQTDRVTLETRVSAGSNVVSLATLNQYAQQTLATMKDGTLAYTLTVSQNSPEAFMVGIGDDVGIDLSGPEFPDHPRTVARLAGIQFDASTVSPILVGADTSGG